MLALAKSAGVQGSRACNEKWQSGPQLQDEEFAEYWHQRQPCRMAASTRITEAAA